MRPKERRDSGQNDFFKARLDQIIDMDHALAKLGRAIDWRFLEERFGAVYSDKVGHPPLPTRLMAGFSILKHMHDLSDEELCAGSRIPITSCSVMGGTVPAPPPCRRCAWADQQRDQTCPPSQSLGWISRRTCFRFMAPRPTAPLCSRDR